MKEINLVDFIECTRDNIQDIQDKLDEIILNLMTDELESFINNYLRYYND